jgi:DNA invertase Pin-like site-specific DNA recombinase
MPQLKGSQHHQAKLSEPQVRLILSSRPGERGIAKAFGVSRAQVSRIRRREEWKHLTEPQSAA